MSALRLLHALLWTMIEKFVTLKFEMFQMFEGTKGGII